MAPGPGTCAHAPAHRARVQLPCAKSSHCSHARRTDATSLRIRDPHHARHETQLNPSTHACVSSTHHDVTRLHPTVRLKAPAPRADTSRDAQCGGWRSRAARGVCAATLPRTGVRARPTGMGPCEGCSATPLVAHPCLRHLSISTSNTSIEAGPLRSILSPKPKRSAPRERGGAEGRVVGCVPGGAQRARRPACLLAQQQHARRSTASPARLPG